MRVGADFLRLQDGTTLCLPSDIYRLVGARRVENFVLTPVEAVRPNEADRKEAHWMRKWGLGGLRNRALPALHLGMWGFLQ